MTTALPRLPVQVPPAHWEVIDSYLDRLAELNHLRPDLLRGHLTVVQREPAYRRVLVVDRLAAVTGYRIDQLAWAIPDLRQPAPNYFLFNSEPMPACPHCTSRHRGGPVLRLIPHHRHICTRHGYWVGLPNQRPMAMPLPDLPELITAQHRHRYLARRRGWARAFQAFHDAASLCQQMHLHQLHGPDHPWRRRRPLLEQHRVRWEIADTPLHATLYPEAVLLAPLLQPERIHAVRSAPHHSPLRRTFYRDAHDRIAIKAGRAIPADHPLRRWLEHPRPGHTAPVFTYRGDGINPAPTPRSNSTTRSGRPSPPPLQGGGPVALFLGEPVSPDIRPPP